MESQQQQQPQQVLIPLDFTFVINQINDAMKLIKETNTRLEWYDKRDQEREKAKKKATQENFNEKPTENFDVQNVHENKKPNPKSNSKGSMTLIRTEKDFVHRESVHEKPNHNENVSNNFSKILPKMVHENLKPKECQVNVKDVKVHVHGNKRSIPNENDNENEGEMLFKENVHKILRLTEVLNENPIHRQNVHENLTPMSMSMSMSNECIAKKAKPNVHKKMKLKECETKITNETERVLVHGKSKPNTNFFISLIQSNAVKFATLMNTNTNTNTYTNDIANTITSANLGDIVRIGINRGMDVPDMSESNEFENEEKYFFVMVGFGT